MSEIQQNTDPVIGIIGLGLIGGSIAKDLHEAADQPRVVAFDTETQALDDALKSGHIHESLSIAQIARIATTMVIAAPIDHVASIGLEIRDELRELSEDTDRLGRKLVIDVASVKKPVSTVFSLLTSDSVDFVATHPMAGTEFTGFGHARKGLFRAKPWIICPHENNSESAVAQTESFVEQFGPHIRVMDADLHDREAAVVSHSIIALSNLIFEFISLKHPDALELAGDGFNSTTRLASGNPEMHASIVRANRGFVFQYLDEFRDFIDQRLDELRFEKDLQPFFENNMVMRNDWLRNKKNT